MPVPVFSVGEVLTAANMNAVGLWRITGCTVTSVGGTSATASNGVITIGNGNTTVTVANAFSDDYENYRIMFTNIDTSQTAGSVSMSLNGATGSTYSVGGLFGEFGTTTLNGYGPAATTKWTDVVPVSDTMSSGVVELYQPKQARPTFGVSNGVDTGGTAATWYTFHLRETSSSASTGFILTLSAGGSFVSGTVRVYGYRL